MKADTYLVAKTLFPLLFSLGTAAGATENGGWRIEILSGRPDMVSGGDALVRIFIPEAGRAGARRIQLNEEDVTSLFQAGSSPGELLGRISGLRRGHNQLNVFSGVDEMSSLDLVNHPKAGPVFSGPHQTPFICQTERAGLERAIDDDCNATTVVGYLYKSTKPASGRRAEGVPAGWRVPAGFKMYNPSGPRPPDMAHTTTSQGKTVDYIVRRESGTINRATYTIAFLQEPGQPLPDPRTKSPGWNGRLVYLFGGGCKAGYHQGVPMGVFNEALLSKGYAVATSSQNVFGNNCNDLISAETLMMVKEHFIEQFGVPIHTIGWGGSGGAMQQYLVAQNYPRLLDGIIPALSYPDIISIIPPVVDCSLLIDAFERSSETWTEDQKKAVSGYPIWKTCQNWSKSYSPSWLDPKSCNPNLPEELVYDPVLDRGGARCDIYDNQINAFGRDPKTGFARRPLDNVGVQYGLVALNSGVINAAQFLDLNQKMGGYDTDGNIVSERTRSENEAVAVAYLSGRINSGAGGLARIPIIDVRPYSDPSGNIHDSFRSFVSRARLVASNGHAENHVIWVVPSPGREGAAASRLGLVLEEALALMDRWLCRIDADDSKGSIEEKLARNKPPELQDACWTPEGEKIEGPWDYQGTNRCAQLYPSHGDPRIAAGGPLADDVLKCRLKPIDAGDYQHPLTEAQRKLLETIFPDGVCDYSRPETGGQKPLREWQRYGSH